MPLGVYQTATVRDGDAIVCKEVILHLDVVSTTSFPPEWSGKLLGLNNTILASGRKYTLEVPGYAACTIRIVAISGNSDSMAAFTGIGPLPLRSASSRVEIVTLPLCESIIKKLEPCRDEIFQRLLQGQELEHVAAEIGNRLGATPTEVKAFYDGNFTVITEPAPLKKP